MDGYLRAEISVSAIQHNVRLIQKRLGPGVKLCPVVKANAYGLGIGQVLPVFEESAEMLGVAICSEAVGLRRQGWQRPVLMFATSGASDAKALAELIAHTITLTVTSRDELKLLAEAEKRASRPGEVHVKIDSGMTRSGVLPERAAELVAAVRSCKSVTLKGLYTHFACAESDRQATLDQLRRFLQAVEACGGRAGLVLHAANSAATIDLPDAHLDMVRPGLALYGYHPDVSRCTSGSGAALALRPALRLTAPIVQIKDVPAGASTGYGLTYRFDRSARVALVPIGYADGYFRSFSNRAVMRVQGVDCPIRGRVSMDQTIIEITGAPQAKVGDAVEIISPDPAAPHSVENLARLAETIPYEIITRLGDRITRVVSE